MGKLIPNIGNLGDFDYGSTIIFLFGSSDKDGGSIGVVGGAYQKVYKDNNTAQSTAGLSYQQDFDSITGIHRVTITTSDDGNFYTEGSNFNYVNQFIIDGELVTVPIASFSIKNRLLKRVPMFENLGWIGDFVQKKQIYVFFTTNDHSGASHALAYSEIENANFVVYRDGDNGERTEGIYIEYNFDGITGLHRIHIDTQHVFYEKRKEYSLVCNYLTINENTPISPIARFPIASFTIKKRLQKRLSLVENVGWLGNFAIAQEVNAFYSVNDHSGGSVSSNIGYIRIYKTDSLDWEDIGCYGSITFDSITGINHLKIDILPISFYLDGGKYNIILKAINVDGETVNSQIASFGVESSESNITARYEGALRNIFPVKRLIDE